MLGIDWGNWVSWENHKNKRKHWKAEEELSVPSGKDGEKTSKD